MLTRKQHELLSFIDSHLKETGVSPSFEEMKEALSLRSKSGIHRLISALEERGFWRATQVNLEYLLQSAAGGLGGSQYAQQMPTTSVDHVTSYLDQLAIAGQQQQAQQQQHAGSGSEPQVRLA